MAHVQSLKKTESLDQRWKQQVYFTYSRNNVNQATSSSHLSSLRERNKYAILAFLEDSQR